MATYEENQIIEMTRPYVFARITGFNAAREKVDTVLKFRTTQEVRLSMKDANRGRGVYTAILNDGTMY